MVQCFAPDFSHYSESHDCRFYSFPSSTKKEQEYKRWVKLLRRLDRCPGKHSRVCSCHFRDGDKSNGPEMFTRNASKPFPPDDYSTKGRKTKKRKIEENEKDSVHNLVERLKPKEDSEEIKQNKKVPVTEIVLRAKLRE